MAQQTIGTPVKATPYTVSFQENVKGWVSFKSFIPENGISCASNYFTFNKGRLFKHHDESKLVSRNTFYDSFEPSTVDFIFNQASGTIKSFEAINYEGSQAKVEAKKMLSGQLVSAGVSNTVNLDNYGENFEITARDGWYVQNLETEQDKGTLKEFVNKEKKWFNYIYGTNLNVSEDSTVGDYDPRNFANQGLGVVTESPINEIVQGCTCNGSNQNGNGVVVDCTSAGDLGYNFVDGTVAAFNYYDAAQVDDGTCVEVVHGCIDANATNYNAGANTDDGSCYTLGCTDELAINYNELADTACNSTGLPDDPSSDPDFANDCCTFCNYGCTNSGANNYDATATCDGKWGLAPDGMSCDDLGEGIDCGCEEIEYGCLDTNDYSFSNTTIENLSTTANTEDGSCVYNGCSDQNAEYFRVPLPMPYDSSHLSLANPAAFAIDADGFLLDINICSSGLAGDPLCATRACWSVINDMQTDSLNADYQSYLSQLQGMGSVPITTLQPCPTSFFNQTNCTYAATGCTDPGGCSYNPSNTVDDGSCLYCGEGNYFNYDGGFTLSGGTCGPSTQTGNCVGCPIVDASSMAIQSQDPNEVSLWFDVTFTSQLLIDLGDDSSLGGKPNWLNTPGFKFRIYDLNTIPTGGSAWNDADYEVVDFTSAFGAPGAGFLADHNTTGSNVKESTFKSTVLQPGVTSVVGSRQGGTISTSTGYNGNTTLSLGCGHQYQIALQTQCVNPDNNHSSTADWQQNVGVITTDSCIPPDVDGCTDATACNYDPLATIDDGSCNWSCSDFAGCMDPALVININAPTPGEHAINYDANFTYDCNGYPPNAASGPYGDNSCCKWRGCTDPTHPAYDAQATHPDHNLDYRYCKVQIPGCTDKNACNYDPSATVNDGSCCGKSANDCGCTDPTACNYNKRAKCDDGSCIMPPCICPGFTKIPDLEFREKLNAGGYDFDPVVNWYDASENPVSDYTAGEFCKKNDICHIAILGINGTFSNPGQITDLTGIEDFIALTNLNCRYNQLTSFDVSQNTNLSTLVCANNQLTSLDVTQNTALEYLLCASNQLTTLDVSNNLALWSLVFSDNNITSIDVSQNTALTWLSCSQNPITILDLSQNTLLTHLYGTYTDITSLDLSNNPSFTHLEFQGHQLTTLDLSNNPALTHLYLSDGLLTSLDLTNNPNMEAVDVGNNQLTSLDLRNGANIARVTTGGAAGAGNPNLTCISVNDVVYATAQLTILIPNLTNQYYYSKSSWQVYCAGPCTGGTC